MPYEAKSYNINLLSEENVKKNVLPYYGLANSEICQIKFKDTDKQRAIYKVTCENLSYCLKKVYYSKEDLLFIYSAIEWLCRNGINVPKILPSLNYERFTVYNNMLFILTPWIDGQKCNYDNIQNVLDASSNLARMHNKCINFFPILGSSKRSGFEDVYVSIHKHFEQLLNCSNMAFRYKDKFSKLFLEYFDSNYILSQNAVNIASEINTENLSRSLCHMDYVNKNIIFDINNDIWVIDFDKCKMDYCVHDISYFLRRILKRNKTRWNLETAINCLNVYEKIHPLNIDEYKYIFVYLSFPQKFWKISKDYYNNINKCNKNSFLTLISACESQIDFQMEFSRGFVKYIEDKFCGYI